VKALFHFRTSYSEAAAQNMGGGEPTARLMAELSQPGGHVPDAQARVRGEDDVEAVARGDLDERSVARLAPPTFSPRALYARRSALDDSSSRQCSA
jgi:hypothetical protein